MNLGDEELGLNQVCNSFLSPQNTLKKKKENLLSNASYSPSAWYPTLFMFIQFQCAFQIYDLVPTSERFTWP